MVLVPQMVTNLVSQMVTNDVGRGETDPDEFRYRCELGLFDGNVTPLAKKLALL
jgi:hypothetical protein